MELPDEVEPAAKARNAKQSEMEKKWKRNRDARVKIMKDEIYSKGSYQDTDIIDQNLEQERAHERFRLLKLEDENIQKVIDKKVEKGNKKCALNEDVQDVVEESQGQDTNEECQDELKNAMGDAFLIEQTHEKDVIVGDLQVEKKKEETEEEIVQNQKKEEMIKKGMGDIFLAAKAPPLLALFKDNKRRIDLMIVLEDDHRPNVQAIKVDFITNIIKTGLEVEYEAGVMKKHKHLIFVKIHASDKVLEDYAGLLGVKKYFKDKHLDFIKTENFFMLLFQFRHECEWIKLVRSQYVEPLKYSNLERSYVVYMLLRHLRFGEPSNYYCLTRLLHKKIIVDVYALHDGPYFTYPKQDYKLFSARQILFYNWAGFENICTFQPINLVYEYFGPKIGFYFAFYEFYNIALLVPVVLGTFVFIYQYSKFETFRPTMERPGRDTFPSKKLFYRLRESDFPCGHYGKNMEGGFDNFYLCPKCRNFSMCPFLKLDDICDSVYIKSFFDNHTAIYFSFIICVMVILLVRFWERCENYYKWMWELGHAPKNFNIRSECKLNYQYPTRSKDTGLWLTGNKPILNIITHLISRIMLWACGFGAAALTVGLLSFNIYLMQNYMANLETKQIYPEYIILSVVAIVGCAAAFVCERICWAISYMATKLENHRLYEEFESSYILKVFSCSFAFTFPMLFYTALVKGSLYFTPIFNYSPEIKITMGNNVTKANFTYDWLGDLFITNCGYYAGCWDEVVLYYTMIMIFKVVAIRIPKYIWYVSSDYNQGILCKVSKKIPSWEREYSLDTITEQTIVLKINDLMIQISLLALFGFTNNWTMLMAYIINLWDLRNDARVFLLSCRRPLLFRYEGLGLWNYILYFICYAAPVTMGLMLMKSSSLPLAYTFETLQDTARFGKPGDQRIGWIIYLRLTRFRIDDFDLVQLAKESLKNYTKTKPTECYFGGMFEVEQKLIEIEWPFTEINVTYPGGLIYNRFHYKQKVVRGVLFLCYVYAVLAVFLLLHYYFPGRDQKTKECVHRERNLLRVHLHNEAGGKKHSLDGAQVTAE